MTDYQKKVELATVKASEALQRIEEGKTLKLAVKTFLNEEIEDGKTVFREIMLAKRKLALHASSEMVRNEAQNSLLRLVDDNEEDGKRGGLPSNNQFIINVNPVKADPVEINSKVINED
jgi:hypothetical protein